MERENKSKTIREWAEDDRPREKLLLKGKAALSDAELVAILIASGNNEESAVDLSKRILSGAGDSLVALSRQSVTELTKFKGIGEAKAISIVAALELGRRRQAEPPGEKKKIASSRDAFEILQLHLADAEYEMFGILLLNRANNPIGFPHIISEGGTSGTVADPRRILRLAIEYNASGLILSHNHPSGNLTPSDADIKLTKKIREAALLIDVTLLDHLIISGNRFYSLADEGQI
jgi:DNA repair protein RadC